jgi:hypothetical protein
LFSRLLVLALVAGAALLPQPASAIPLFAQRYRMQCGACHSVLPELNAFGNAFRQRGYQLPVPKHCTTGVALRYQLEDDRNPAPGAKPLVPGAVLLSNADVGRISAYLHYNFGAQGGPAGTYLAYLTTYDQHSKTQVRLGLFELPLIHSPGQRLDDLTTYGYEGTHVGLNDLTFAQPRLGLEAEQHAGTTTVAATLAIGEFKGAAYGGKPIDTGVNTRAGRPEFGAFIRTPVTAWLALSGDALAGTREIFPTGRDAFLDGYRRTALGADAHHWRWSILAEQWWGNDANADGFGTTFGSSGGFARLRYALGDHAYLGVRYDTAAAPLATRDVVVYGATQLGRHVRLIVENKHTYNGATTMEGALTFGIPWPLGPGL